MSVVPDEISGQISGPGTSEDDWRPWLSRQLRDWPVLEFRMIPAPVVIAPHPDDEVLAVGGLLALADSPVTIGLSDGEASHPRSPTTTPAALAGRRQSERQRALQLLRGASSARQVHLDECHLPDGSLVEHESQIADRLTARLGSDSWCFAPLGCDGHPDHEAAGRAAAAACQATGARLLSYPVWSWHWGRPADPRLPWHRATWLPLSTEIQARKAAAIAAFASQIHPLSDAPADSAILSPAILERFRRPYEVFFR